MLKIKWPFLIASSCALILAGCSSQRFDQQPVLDYPVYRPAPVSPVQQSDLPAPADMSVPQATVDLSTQAQPEGALELTPASVAGVWRASINGTSCQLATPQTKFGQGYRAGPLHCPSGFSEVKSWAVHGKQLAFYDMKGSIVASLYSNGAGSFDGQTVFGQAVSLSR